MCKSLVNAAAALRSFLLADIFCNLILKRSILSGSTADRGDGLQIWRIAANILNKQSRTADSGWSSILGVGRGLTTPHRRTIFVTKYYTQPRAGCCECGDGPPVSSATYLAS
jgi:hypothetical protein